MFNSIATGLAAPTQSATGIIAATASPAFMVRVGRIIFDDIDQKIGQPSNIQPLIPANVPNIGDVFNAIPSYK